MLLYIVVDGLGANGDSMYFEKYEQNRDAKVPERLRVASPAKARRKNNQEELSACYDRGSAGGGAAAREAGGARGAREVASELRRRHPVRVRRAWGERACRAIAYPEGPNRQPKHLRNNEKDHSAARLSLTTC